MVLFVFPGRSCYFVDCLFIPQAPQRQFTVMHHIKARLLGLVLILLGIVLVYLNWRDLWNEGTYSLKLAAFGPLVGIGGIFLLLFPARAGKPTTTAEKVTVLIVFAIGLVAGLINWYLMDPGYFGQ